MKALLIVLMVALVAVHVWLSHQRFHGPNKVFLSDDQQVQLADGVTMRTEYLDRILEGSISAPDDATHAIEAVRGMQPPGRIIDRLSLGSSMLISWSGDRMTLKGQVRDEATRRQIIEVAAMPVDDDQLVVNKNVTSTNWEPELPALLINFITATQTTKQGEINIQTDSVSLKGKVANAEQKQKLLSLANSWGLSVKDGINYPQGSSTLLAKLSGGVVSLAGQVPSSEIKKQLGEQVSKAGHEVDNQLAISDNVVAPKWLDQAESVLPGFFTGVKQGEFEVGKDFVRVNREVKDKKSIDRLIKSLKGFGLKVINQLSLPKSAKPTQAASILASLANKTLTLTGKVPSDSLGKSIVETTRRAMPGIKVYNRLVVDKEKIKTPSWNDQVAPMAVDFFAGAPKSAEFEIGSGFVRFKKEVGNQASKKRLVAMARGILPNGKFVDQLVVKQALEEPTVVVAPTPKPKPKPKPKPEAKPTKSANVLAVLSGGRLKITGQVPTQELKDYFTTIARKAIPNLSVSNQLVVDAKTVKRPSWGKSFADVYSSFWATKPSFAEFELSSDKVRLKQALKNEATRDLLLVKARRLVESSNRKVVNQLTVARSKPRPTQRPATTLKSPSVPLIKPANILVVLKGKQLTLSGKVPTHDMRLSIAEAAIKARPRAKMTNNIEVDKEVRIPAWDLKVLGLLSDFLSSTANSEFEVNPNKIRLKQALPTQSIKDIWEAKAKRFMPGSNRFINELSVSSGAPMPAIFDPSYRRPEKQESISAVENLEIYFLTNSTWVKPKHQQQIQNLARSIKGMGYLPRVEVKGFADQRGSYSLNKSLSEGRAKEVVNSLVKNGVARSSIQVLAVGETESNSSSERDRRVEIRILKMR